MRIKSLSLIEQNNMSSRVLIIQDASVISLDTLSVKHVMQKLPLTCGDIVRFLGIIQAFISNKSPSRTACGSFLQFRNKLHSSATISKHKKDIEKETQKMLIRYTSCAQVKEILDVAQTLQVRFDIAVEAGSLKEVAVEYVKSFQATHVILHRQLKKEVKYFTQNLSCGISIIKSDIRIENIRPPQVNQESVLKSSDPETSVGNLALEDSMCPDRRLHVTQKKRFSYSELQIATNGFSLENIVVSSYGNRIYHGLLTDGTRALIRENPSVTMPEDEFEREVEILERLGHENVASLMGSCLEGPHRLLVYEYVCNGSLEQHLSNQSKTLTWENRIKIAYGAAKGLEYLHQERIYGRVNPNNILMTHEHQPLISYYGLLRNQYEISGMSLSNEVMRTFEYLAPEYNDSNVVDLSKADVYSFGVVLLELITGRKTLQDTDGQSFLRWARPRLKNKKYMELIDPLLQESVDLYQLYWMVRVADKCLRLDPNRRFSMRKVVEALSGIMQCSGVGDYYSSIESEI